MRVVQATQTYCGYSTGSALYVGRLDLILQHKLYQDERAKRRPRRVVYVGFVIGQIESAASRSLQLLRKIFSRRAVGRCHHQVIRALSFRAAMMDPHFADSDPPSAVS